MAVALFLTAPQREDEEITQVDLSVRDMARAMREVPAPVTRAQALYAVLWQGAPASEIRRYL